jgi:hypothetical protein
VVWLFLVGWIISGLVFPGWELFFLACLDFPVPSRPRRFW